MIVCFMPRRRDDEEDWVQWLPGWDTSELRWLLSYSTNNDAAVSAARCQCLLSLARRRPSHRSHG